MFWINVEIIQSVMSFSIVISISSQIAVGKRAQFIHGDLSHPCLCHIGIIEINKQARMMMVR